MTLSRNAWLAGLALLILLDLVNQAALCLAPAAAFWPLAGVNAFALVAVIAWAHLQPKGSFGHVTD